MTIDMRKIGSEMEAILEEMDEMVDCWPNSPRKLYIQRRVQKMRKLVDQMDAVGIFSELGSFEIDDELKPQG